MLIRNSIGPSLAILKALRAIVKVSYLSVFFVSIEDRYKRMNLPHGWIDDAFDFSLSDFLFDRN
jgi:hypothetical protein